MFGYTEKAMPSTKSPPLIWPPSLAGRKNDGCGVMRHPLEAKEIKTMRNIRNLIEEFLIKPTTSNLLLPPRKLGVL